MKKIFLILLFSVSSAFGAEIKEVFDGAEIMVSISKKDLNRIKVVDDRILHIKYSDEEIVKSAVDELGEVYLKPASGGSKPLSIFLITEKGHTYKLMLVPSNIPSSQVILKNVGGELAKGFGNSLSVGADTAEKQDIVELIKLMQGGILPSKGKYEVADDTKTIFSATNLKAKRKKIYRGEIFVGFVVTVANKGDTEIKIAEKTFYSEGVRAILMESNTIPSKSEITMFIVSKL